VDGAGRGCALLSCVSATILMPTNVVSSIDDSFCIEPSIQPVMARLGTRNTNIDF